MDANELIANIRKLRQLLGEGQLEADYRFRNDILSKAEGIAYDLQVEMEIRQGEEILASVTQ